MTPAARSLSSAAGFTFIELLVASAMFVAMAGAMIELARAAQMASTAIGDAADVQQKMRVAADAIQHDLSVAGAGSALPAGGGSLARFLPSIRPSAGIAGDSDISFAPDRVTILYTPSTRTRTRTLSQRRAPEYRSEARRRARRPRAAGSSATCVRSSSIARVRDLVTTCLRWPTRLVRSWHVRPMREASRVPTPRVPTWSKSSIIRPTWMESDPSNIRLMRGDGKTAFPLVDGVRDLHFTYYADPDPASAPAIGAAGGTCVYSSGAATASIVGSLGWCLSQRVVGIGAHRRSVLRHRAESIRRRLVADSAGSCRAGS